MSTPETPAARRLHRWIDFSVGTSPGELSDLMSWVSCLADARPAEAYSAWLTDVGFIHAVIKDHNETLTEMIRGVGTRLFAAEVLLGLGKLDLVGIDLPSAKRLAKQAMVAVAQHRLGYAIVHATNLEREQPARSQSAVVLARHTS
jgi:arsenite methyltransferase